MAGRKVAVDVPSDLPMVAVDAGLVDQLLVNLLENVLRYTPAGSPVDVRVAFEHDRLTLDVCDRGPGIARHEREKVFDKFYRGLAAKRNDGGTGLGLTICRAVARAHDGEMSILPRVDGGSIFRLSLPFASSIPAASMIASRRMEA
jgi:two-component system sensor histidine kinase KdpD